MTLLPTFVDENSLVITPTKAELLGFVVTDENLKDLPAGTYILELTHGKESAVCKFDVIK